MRRMSAICILLTAAVVAACDTPTAPESVPPVQATVYRDITERFYELDDVVLILDCIDEAWYDEVMLEGGLYYREVFTIDAAGGYHYNAHSMPVNLWGTSTVTGERYRIQEREARTGVQRESGFTSTWRNVLTAKSADSHRSFLLVSSGHVREGDDGQPVVVRDNFTGECR